VQEDETQVGGTPAASLNGQSATAVLTPERVGSTPPGESVLRIRGLAKTFPGVQALKGVDLDVKPGTVHALLGQNGCGKSTLIKVLAGFHKPDPGAEAWLAGEPFTLGETSAEINHPLRFVHQDLGIINQLDVIDNFSLSLGYLRTRFGRVDQDAETQRARRLLKRFGLDGLDLSLPMGEATAVERTVVAIARALAGIEPGEGLLVLDEPTAALPSTEVTALFDVIRDVRKSGTAVLYVSHRLDEIFEIADSVTVMQNGRVLHESAVADITPRKLASLIAGQDTGLDRQFLSTPHKTGDNAIFHVRNVRSRTLQGVELHVDRGEILGIAGLLGSGRDEIPYVITGSARSELGASAEWTIDGSAVKALNVNRALDLGIALIPGDRGREAAIREFTVLENMSMAMLPRLGSSRGLQRKRERAEAINWMRKFDILDSHIDRPIATLSGGNQQKVILARWLWSNPKVLVMSEPTAGVDIGARQALYEVLREQAGEGLGVIVCSSDAEDLVATCSRVLVLRDGVFVAELEGEEISTGAIVSATEGADV
jgi:ABC-type sugar transport system ATPase subunit